jgi:hypothetical protein
MGRKCWIVVCAVTEAFHNNADFFRRFAKGLKRPDIFT